MWMFLGILAQALFGFLGEAIKRNWGQRKKPLNIISQNNVKEEIKQMRARLEKLEEDLK